MNTSWCAIYKLTLIMKRYQIMDIYYSGVGVIKGFSPEEQEEVYQLGLERRTKKKTA